MQAYKVKKGSIVRVVDEYVKTPPSRPTVKKGDIIEIEKLDGMYCNCIDENKNRVYIAAWTEVEEI